MLEQAVDGGSCPHIAVLLRTEDELTGVLASFYALGARRNGWLVHRCVSGQADADRAALSAAGLDVGALEAAKRMAVVEFDPTEPPERSTDPWERGLEDALHRGLDALWYSRFAVGPEQSAYDGVLAFERAWDACFHSRPVITLCPYVVGALDAGAALDRLTTLAHIHDSVLVPGADGWSPVAAGSAPR